MANNEIFIQFLVHHKDHFNFVDNLNTGIKTSSFSRCNTPVSRAIQYSFNWDYTERESYAYWYELHNKWFKMCKDLNLTGVVNLGDFLYD